MQDNRNATNILIIGALCLLALFAASPASAQIACTDNLDCYRQPYIREEIFANGYHAAVAPVAPPSRHMWHGRGVALTHQVYGSTAESRMVTP